MTLAQFKRMKPKYKFRLIMVCVIGFLLFLGLLKLLALGIGLIRVQMNTSQLPAATAAKSRICASDHAAAPLQQIIVGIVIVDSGTSAA